MKIVSLLLSAWLAGCVAIPATQMADAPKIAIATADQVTSCAPLGDIEGFSPLHGFFVEQGYENAKRDVMNQAAKLGATHIVWGKQATAFYRTTVVGSTYRCPL